MLDPICKQLKKELVKGRKIKLCNVRFPMKHSSFTVTGEHKICEVPIGTWRNAIVAKIDKNRDIVFACENGRVSECLYPWLFDIPLNVVKEDNLYILSDEYGELLKWEIGELSEFPCEEF
jgi:hypothetical protein